MKPVIQQESSCCGIAASANLAGVSYAAANRNANALVFRPKPQRSDQKQSASEYFLQEFDISVPLKDIPFKTWNSLSNRALMAIKGRTESGKSF